MDGEEDRAYEIMDIHTSVALWQDWTPLTPFIWGPLMP